VRALGVMLFLAAGAAAGACVRETFTARRPRDLAFALAAPVAVVTAIAGLVLAFAPDAL
jgi:hypothetical protein